METTTDTPAPAPAPPEAEPPPLTKAEQMMLDMTADANKAMLDIARGSYDAQANYLLAMMRRIEGLAPEQAATLEHLCQALDALVAKGTEAANCVNLKAVSPQGFTVQFTIRRPTGQALFVDLEKAQEWLLKKGYQPA